MINPSDLLLHVDIRLPDRRPVLYIYNTIYPWTPLRVRQALYLTYPEASGGNLVTTLPISAPGRSTNLPLIPAWAGAVEEAALDFASA